MPTLFAHPWQVNARLLFGFEDDLGGSRYLLFETFPYPCRGAREHEMVLSARVECAQVVFLPRVYL